MNDLTDNTIAIHYKIGATPEPKLIHFARTKKNPEFWLLKLDTEVSVMFWSAEQLQAFDEACHGDIEDALFRHVHGQHTLSEEAVRENWNRAIADLDKEGA